MDADKIKNFFIFHIEKMVVVVVIGLSGFLVYSGLGKPLILEKNQPEKLTEEAKQVRASIDDDHNQMVLENREPPFDILARTNRSTTAVDESPYKWPYIWEPKNIDGSVRRQDPVFVAPRDLYVKGVIGTIAVRSNSGDYSIKNLEAADAVEVVEKKVVKKKKKRRASMEDMYGEMEMGMGMDMGMEDMYNQEMMGGSMAGPTTAGRTLDPKFDFGGLRPTATAKGQKPVPEVAWFIAGTAVMPHKEMFEAFEFALKDADGYLPTRDIPLYYNLELQRADVTDRGVDTLQDADWVNRGNREIFTYLAKDYWAGVSKELVPGEYRDPALTSYIPPFLLDDYSTFTLHPLVPLTVKKETTGAAEDLSNLPEAQAVIPGEERPEAVFALPGGGNPYQSMPEYGMDPMLQQMMQGMSMNYGMGMSNQKPVEYKLIRFYDFFNGRDKTTPRPGRKYVYRIRVGLIDPNFPVSPVMQPRSSTLSKEVYDRVADLLITADKQRGDRLKGRLFQRWTDWSQLSEAVSLPNPSEFFVGPVKAPAAKPIKIGNRDIPYSRDDATAKLVTSQFDLSLKARIPLVMDITDGTVLSAKGTADLVDPITLEIKKLPDAEIKSQATVVDLEGGQPLEITAEENMTVPAMILLFDDSGELIVSDEVSDQEFYRVYSYAEEKGE